MRRLGSVEKGRHPIHYEVQNCRCGRDGVAELQAPVFDDVAIASESRTPGRRGRRREESGRKMVVLLRVRRVSSPPKSTQPAALSGLLCEVSGALVRARPGC